MAENARRKRKLSDPLKKTAHKGLKRLKTSVIVSGFPRSGTTLMMRVLHAGGLEVLADPKRQKPVNVIDSYGDWEFDNFYKVLVSNKKSWTAGKVLKIVAPFAEFIPLDRPVKVIFMLRDVTEIITSLMAMQNVWELDPIEAINRARTFLQAHEIPTLYVKLNELSQYPKTTCTWLADFVDRDLDINAMVAETKKKARKQKSLDGNLLLFKGKPIQVDYTSTDKEVYIRREQN